MSTTADASFLDWSKHRVNATPRPCRACAMPAFMTDAKGVPCHKVCAEREIAQRAEFHAGGGAR